VLGANSRAISEYTSLSGDYEGFSASERRPDVFVRLYSASGIEHRVLVEIKETADARYKRDSVYKALAYLRDFSQLWDSVPDQSPRAILVFPSDIRLKAGASDAGRDLVFTSADDRSRLAKLLARASES
jgi:hypothetical protein